MAGVFRRAFRQVPRRIVIYGVGAPVVPAPVVPVAKMLMERHGKIMRERMARKPVMLSAPIPVVVGSTLFPAKPFIPRPPAPIKVPARVPVFGIPAVPGVGSVPFVFRPSFRTRPSPTLPQRVFVIPTATPVGEVTVCTSGTWSATIVFAACDAYRLEIDGPATDNVRVSVNIELEET